MGAVFSGFIFALLVFGSIFATQKFEVYFILIIALLQL